VTTLQRKVRREAQGGSYGPIIVTLAPEGIYTREKGRRTTYGPIAFSHIHTLGAMMRVAQIKKERVMARKAKRLSRD
jgi:hypothetical protein